MPGEGYRRRKRRRSAILHSVKANGPPQLDEPGWGRPYGCHPASCRFCRQLIWLAPHGFPATFITALECSIRRTHRCTCAAINAVHHGPNA